MRNRYVIMLALGAAALAGLVPGMADAQDRKTSRPQSRAGMADGGVLSTMPHGLYECAVPGDAGGEAYIVIAEESFRIGTASSYTNAQGNGIYLMRGRGLVFTRGPKKDQRFRRIGDNMLQKLAADGSLGKLICTRRGSPD